MKEESKKHKENNRLTKVGLSLIFVAVILLILYFLHGETTIEKGYLGIDGSDAFSCSANDVDYFFTDSPQSFGNTVTINAIFLNDELRNIFIIYSLLYAEEIDSLHGTSRLGIAMDKEFGKNSINPDNFNATYSTHDKRAQMTMYAKADEINTITGKYFMTNGIAKTYQVMLNEYINAGFECSETINPQI